MSDAERNDERLAHIQRAKQEWESTADALPQLICLLDRQGHIVRTNRTVERWGLGTIHDVRGRRLHELLHAACTDEDCALRTWWRRAWEALLAGQADEYEYEDAFLARCFHIEVRPLFQQAQHKSEMTSLAVVVVEDITDRKRAEQALQRRTLELQARNEELDAFAHTVAHDLKNPVGVIMGYADIVKRHGANMPETDVETLLDAIVENGRTVIGIIDGLLLFASVRQEDVTPVPVDMASVVAGALRRLALMIEESEAEVILPETWPTALGYAPWLEEVWTNYLSNAIKYGGKPPRVELGAVAESDHAARFWVRDNGDGLTPEEQERLFTPFTRIEQLRATGHGLGLSIVLRIIEKLNGQVNVESEPGCGSTFSFTLQAETS